MKTNLKFSSRMHLFIIITVAVIVLGLVVGLACKFAANGYFNYGADWADYKSIQVSCATVDFQSEDEMREICDNALSEAGVKSSTVSYGDLSGKIVGKQITYRFTTSTDSAKLEQAVQLISAAFEKKAEEKGGLSLSSASYHEAVALEGAGRAIRICAVAIAAVIVFQCIYMAVRFKLTTAFAALLADVHNLCLFLALLAITRIPVGSSVIGFAVLTVLATVIGTCFMFDSIRKNGKEDSFKKLSAFEQTDMCANESFKANIILPACLAILGAALFVLLSISSLSPLAIISPVFCAIVAFVACAYGTAFFTPSVYSRIKQIGASFKKEHTRLFRSKLSGKSGK